MTANTPVSVLTQGLKANANKMSEAAFLSAQTMINEVYALREKIKTADNRKGAIYQAQIRDKKVKICKLIWGK